MHSAKEADPDVGLCRLLEGLPADPEALRPAELSLPCTTEDLGGLEAGKDHTFQLVIENQGMLLLSGIVVTDSDWFFFSDSQGNSSQKLFQTRDTYTLSVRVPGSNLRAGPKPLEGQIIVDTNGGRQTVAVHATVPVRPFPRGETVGNVLAGAKSPRELAVKAKAHPNEAAVQFEQGVVKAWYESNGWTYPIQGTQARGNGALQQFFEALGLVKPPKLAIDTERISCRGAAGERLTKQVTLRTEEPRPVYADASSNQRWIKVLPAKAQGNSVTIPLRIDVPNRPGETLDANVTVQGNGQQRFVVPVALTIAGTSAKQRKEKEVRSRRLEWIAGGVVLFLFLIGGTWVARAIFHHNDPVQPSTEMAALTGQQPPPVQVARWYDKIPNNNLGECFLNVKQVAGENRPIVDHLEADSAVARRKGYEELGAKLPELSLNSDVNGPLSKFLTECCVFEPDGLNLQALLSGLAALIPEENLSFPDKDKGEEVTRAAFCQRVVCSAVTHKDVKPETSERIAIEMNKNLATSVSEDALADDLKNQIGKSIAEQCYHKILVTARDSLDQALAIRTVLGKQFPDLPAPDFRAQEDAQVLEIALPRAKSLWPQLEPMFKTCAECDQPDTGRRVIDFYEKADAPADKMDAMLAVKWKTAANPQLSRTAKATAIRRIMTFRAVEAKITRAERVAELQKLLDNGMSSPAKPGVPATPTPLQDSVRLAHANALASILFNKDAEPGQFDQLLTRTPALAPPKPEDKPTKPVEKPVKPEMEKVITLGTGIATVTGVLQQDKRDARRGGSYYRFVKTVTLKVGETYEFSVESKDMTPLLRLERLGQQGPSVTGNNVKLTYTAPVSADFDVVVSSLEKNTVGNFSLKLNQVQKPQMGFRGFAPETTTTAEVERKVEPVATSDLIGLRDPDTKVRLESFKNLIDKLPKELAYADASRISLCLLTSRWKESELGQLTERVKPLANNRSLLYALNDVIFGVAKTDLDGPRTQAIVGALVGKRLDDEDWQSDCRKELLQRALELTPHTASDLADKAAEFLRDLYKEQGLAFGLDDADFNGQTQLTAVLERLIKHVAERSAQREASPAKKDFLQQIERHIQAARYVAHHEVQYAVLLQRIWIKVLTLTLEQDVAEPARKKMTELDTNLDKKDGQSDNLLAQLRLGEETILRLWALTFDLKIK
jgi:hypothetical protein